MMAFYIAAALSLTVFLSVAGISLISLALHDPEQQRVRRHLYDPPFVSRRSLHIDITRRRVLSDVPWLHRRLSALPLALALARFIEQTNSPYRLSTFLILSLVLCIAGLLTLGPPLQLAGGLGLGLMPLVGLYLQKQRRLRRFEHQLPDALDLVARALKAGHTFKVGMKMVGDEFPDPIGTEFSKAVDEINFGNSIQEALTHFSERIDCLDLRFFVTAVMVQRETGGNLAEIIDKSSHLIRQRFELLGRIRVLSGEGKISAMILLALPFLIGGATYLFNREYLLILITDPLGKWLSMLACVLMVLGSLIIVRMVRIKM
jgi:tight adherence protein B